MIYCCVGFLDRNALQVKFVRARLGTRKTGLSRPVFLY